MRRLGGTVLAVTAVLLVFVGHPAAQVVALAAAMAAALVMDSRAIKVALRLGVVLTAAFSSAVAGAVVVWSSDWASGRDAATAMLLRLLVLVILATLLARNVDAEALLRTSRRLGMERLGLILGLALNILPRLGESTRHVVMAWRVRRRSKATCAPTCLQLMEVLLAHVARIADEAAAAAALRGHTALLQPPVVVAAATRVVVVTGAPGAGKTTAVLAATERIRDAGCRVVGFVQPRLFDGGRKFGFLVRDLATGEETELARRVDRADGQHGTRFRFTTAGFELARRALSRAGAGDLMVVDELGPLELRGEGHMPAVQQALGAAGLSAAVVVVRRHLIPALLAALRVDDAVVVEITEGEGEGALVGALGYSHGSSLDRSTADTA